MKKQVSNYRSYNIVISTLILIGILFIGLVGNIYNQEAAAQSFNLNLPNIKADIPAAVGTGKIPIQIGNIISTIQTGIPGPVQKIHLPILNKPPIRSDAKRLVLEKAEERLIPGPNAPTNPNYSSVTNDQLSSNYSSFTQSRSDSWNLQGKVYFEGLRCNPKKNTIMIPPCSGPYPNYEIKIFSTKDCKHVVSKTKSDQNGSYRMMLSPGNYAICANSDITTSPFGLEQSKPIYFAVKEGEVTNLDLVIRTGIR